MARAGGDRPAAQRWLERAIRLVPNDPLPRLTLGAVLLEAGDPAAAAPLIAEVVRTHDVPAAWTTLASCHLALGDESACSTALEAALHRNLLDPALASIADRATARWSWPGWCALEPGERVRVASAGQAAVLLDGAPLPNRKLPHALRPGACVDVRGPAAALLGSPLPVDRLTRRVGCVWEAAGAVAGWVWFPSDPDGAPEIQAVGPAGSHAIEPTECLDPVASLPPLARPRRFELPATLLATLGSPLAVTDRRGRHLLGSPLHLGREPLCAALTGPPAIGRPGRGIAVVVPVHRGRAETLACLDSVRATVPPDTRVIVVDDASPEPDLVAALQRQAAAGQITLLRQRDNRGFPAAANAGMAAAAGLDVVLLNSDTLVPPGWLQRLQRAAYAAPEIGTATPLSNDASIVGIAGDPSDPPPDRSQTAAWDRRAAAANGEATVTIPVGVGFCLFIRRDCLDQVGPLREDLFAQGYGEENAFCLRASQAGWRHVAATGVFVAHCGGRSFGRAAPVLRHRNAAVLDRWFPEYRALVEAYHAADPLFAARRRIAALRWAEDRSAVGAVVLLTHAAGGGVAELVARRCEAIVAEGRRPIVLRPAPDGCAIEGCGDLRFAVPAELPDLAALLRPDRPAALEVHHLLGHRRAVLDLARLLAVPIDRWVHDAADYCPRISLVGRDRRYCGEPAVEGCEACITALGSLLPEPIAVRALRARTEAEWAASRRLVVATADGARRLRRYFPHVQPDIVAWETVAPPPIQPVDAATVRVAIVGAIAAEKGFDVLLACAEDARRRALPLEFVVCGFTEDDERLFAAGPVFVTGPFAPHEAVALIRAQRAHLALVPSICPETWCFGLSRAWQAGLPAVAFDLGAQAERIRASGVGALLPLALPPGRVNDALLRLARAPAARQNLQP